MIYIPGLRNALRLLVRNILIFVLLLFPEFFPNDLIQFVHQDLFRRIQQATALLDISVAVNAVGNE